MHEEMKELLAAFVLGELSESESTGVAEHLARCPQCRQEVQRLKKILACTDRLKDVQADPKLCAAVLRDVMASVRREQFQVAAAPAKRFRLAAAAYMRVVKFAAAAAIVLIVQGITHHSGGALGRVAERIELISAYTYGIRMPDEHAIKYYPTVDYASDTNYELFIR